MEDIIVRIKNAVELLKAGSSYKVGELYMGINNDCLNITGVSQYIDLKNITKQGALKELEEIKIMFENMMSISPDLKKFVSNKKLKFNLDFDYGMGDIRICSEIGGDLKWEYQVNNS